MSESTREYGLRRIKNGKWSVSASGVKVGEVVEYLGKFCAAANGDRFIINKVLGQWPTYETIEEAAEHCVNFAKGFSNR